MTLLSGVNLCLDAKKCMDVMEKRQRFLLGVEGSCHVPAGCWLHGLLDCFCSFLHCHSRAAELSVPVSCAAFQSVTGTLHFVALKVRSSECRAAKVQSLTLFARPFNVKSHHSPPVNFVLQIFCLQVLGVPAGTKACFDSAVPCMEVWHYALWCWRM